MSGEPSIDTEWNIRHLRLAIDAAGIALWSWNVDTGHFTMDAQGYSLWDVIPRAFVSFEDLSAKIHPADRDRVRAAFAATRAIVGAYEIDFRIIVGEDVRWISARGQGDDADIEARTMFGVFLDVTGRKQAEEGHELLAGEMSHRVKNLLSIATALTAITSRSSNSATEMAQELTSRVGALGRAHDLVRPLPGRQENGSLLGDLLTIVLAPYDELEAAFSGRIRVAVPRMSVSERGATSLALVLHELATNSVKYGALSVATGTLDVSATAEDAHVVIVWTERGGPPVAAPTTKLGGFGSKLLTHSMTSQLNGSVEHDWCSEGLIVTLRIAKDRLSA
jgi:two-component sensor histidine kinase